MRLMKRVENFFEVLIWNFRFFVLLPVLFGLLSAFKFFMIGTQDIWAGFNLPFDISDPEGAETYKIVSYVIGGIDYYLIGIVLLIFSFGVYELFISKIDVRFEHDINVLQSESLEELKSKLVRVIVVALIVSLFKKMLSLEVSQALDLVYLALAIFLISVSSYLLQLQHASSGEEEVAEEKS
ncbi:MAG: YqhA family protein [Cyanobacteria bacterium J06623_4]